jgi:Ras-related protein Rab-2A
LVYDVARRDSFDHVKKWLEEARTNGSSAMIMMLVGNKCDLEHKRCVSTKEGELFAAENSMLFIETSCKTAENVDSAFENTAARVLQGIDDGSIDVSDEVNLSLPL